MGFDPTKLIMKIPKKIHFSGFDYEIVEVEKLDGTESWGRTQLDQGKIFIEKNMSKDKKEETFIHELLHIAYRHTANGLSNEDEEKLVKAWSLNMYGILKDNNLFK